MFLKRVSLKIEFKQGTKLQEILLKSFTVIFNKWDPNFKN